MLGVSALLILLLFKLLFRREWLAAAALVAVLTLVQALGQRGAGDETPVWLEAAQAAVIMSSFTFLLLRFGLLSAVVGVTFLNTVFSFPLVTDFGSWASGPTTAALLFATAVVGFAFTASQSGLASEASAPRRG
jgi:hypothetical protein